MKKYLPIIFMCLTTIITKGLLAYFIKKDSRDSSNVIRMSKILIIILFLGEIAMLFFGIMAYIYGPLEIAIMLWLFCFLSFLFGWYLVSFQIKVADDSFEKRNVLWKKKKYKFSETIILQGSATMIVQNDMGIEIMRISNLMCNSRLLYERYLSYLKFHKLNKIKSRSNSITCIKFLKYIGAISILLSLLTMVPLVMSVLENEIAGIIASAILEAFVLISGIVILLYFYRWNIYIENDEIIIHRVFKSTNKIKLNECYLIEDGIFLLFYNKQTKQRVYRLARYLLNNSAIILEYYKRPI